MVIMGRLHILCARAPLRPDCLQATPENRAGQRQLWLWRSFSLSGAGCDASPTVRLPYAVYRLVYICNCGYLCFAARTRKSGRKKTVSTTVDTPVESNKPDQKANKEGKEHVLSRAVALMSAAPSPQSHAMLACAAQVTSLGTR